MKCPSCGSDIPVNSRFCPNCGAKQTTIFCPNCGTQVPPTAKFCTNCGSTLEQSSHNEDVATQQTSTTRSSIDVELMCPHCNSVYSVLEEDRMKENLYWDCPSCGGRIDAAFCGYCTQHHGYIAFRPYNNKEILGAAIVGGIAGYNNPEAVIGNLIGSFFDSTPKAKATGVCPKCQTEFVKCPVCNRAVHITYEDGGVVVCPDCHTKFKMN